MIENRAAPGLGVLSEEATGFTAPPPRGGARGGPAGEEPVHAHTLWAPSIDQPGRWKGHCEGTKRLPIPGRDLGFLVPHKPHRHQQRRGGSRVALPEEWSHARSRDPGSVLPPNLLSAPPLPSAMAWPREGCGCGPFTLAGPHTQLLPSASSSFRFPFRCCWCPKAWQDVLPSPRQPLPH